jgi:predicted O-methyltransferase YrrM
MIIEELLTARKLLQSAHESYTTSISSKGMALSLETAAVIWVLCELRQPKSIIDLGSGFSSFVVRKWVQERSKSSTVTSVDDDELWLMKSSQYCHDSGIKNIDRFEYWKTFKSQTNNGKFDLILYDLGRMKVRFENINFSLNLCADDGIVVIDDMHKFNYAIEVKRVVNELGFVACDLKNVSTDAHENRHCWFAVKKY